MCRASSWLAESAQGRPFALGLALGTASLLMSSQDAAVLALLEDGLDREEHIAAYDDSDAEPALAAADKDHVADTSNLPISTGYCLSLFL